jgi:choline dehydrogenase-like flavoprotein
MAYDFDVLVMGSGAGGATFAYACAAAGKKVLLVERGTRYQLETREHDEHAMLIEKRPYDDRTIAVNGVAKQLYIGGVLGGGTSLYGAALMRPSKEDFVPGRFYGQRLPPSLWEWPIQYEDLEPYYDEAETLYGVAGSTKDDFGPLAKPAGGFPGRLLPIKPINRLLMHANQEAGLRPFRLPLAIDFQHCLDCSACPGHICPTGARRSSTHLLDRFRAERSSLQVQTGTEVERMVTDTRGQVNGVLVRDRASGRQTVYRARRYVLAAGALQSPALLLRSGIESHLIGRNYMYHLSPIMAGLFLRPTGGDKTFIKQVGFADYYLGTPGFRHKLGLIQSLPVPGPRMLAKSGGKHLPPRLLSILRERMLPLVGIVEDLPNPANRVTLDGEGRARLQHTFSPYDLQRGRYLGGLMKRILERAGAVTCLARPFPSEEHVAHQCGTLRFGKRAADAVAGPDCRLFGQPNVFVVDGSIFPTSLGVGPALTIMANALRVARIMLREL